MKCLKCGKGGYDASWKKCLVCGSVLANESLSDVYVHEPAHEAPKQDPNAKKMELTIGQYFLNRLGIVSLVVGFAFFIGYSFQFIGALGKVAIVYAASLGLLGLGKHLEKKPDLKWYGFGLIGGGWSLVYFTTYALHHIEAVRLIPDMNLALLALVAVTSLLMADLMRYKSQAITMIVYLLGFFTAGLGHITEFSLVYAALLTFSLVLVVQRMKWNRLMILALVGSYVTHVAWLGPEILLSGMIANQTSLEFSRFLLSAGFLSLYGILFAAAPLAASQETEEDRHIQTTVTVLNAFTYALLMFQEISRIQPEWRFYFALILGACGFLFAAISKLWTKREHLTVAHMTLGISFITMAFPMKLSDRWVDIAWLIEIPVLILLGLWFKRQLYRYFAWGLSCVMAMKILALYASTASPASVIPFLTLRGMITLTAVLGFYAAQAIYLWRPQKMMLQEIEGAAGRVFFVTATSCLFLLTIFDVSSNWISIAWAVSALGCFAAGFGLRDRWFRYTGLSLIGLIVLRVVFYDLHYLPTLHRIALFMGMGAALLGASYLYSRIAASQEKTAR